MPSCLECFCESGFCGRELQKLIDSEHPHFACESHRCSSFSPGPVDDDEELAFILIDPLHYDSERNLVVPEAFQELTNRDLSTLRTSLASSKEADDTRDELIERGKGRIPPQLRLVNEVCTANVSEIRSSEFSGSRLLAVYDTALERAPSHASIFTRGDVLEDKQLRKRVRNKIYEIFSKSIISYEDFRRNLQV